MSDLLLLLQSRFPETAFKPLESSTPPGFEIPTDALLSVCEFLRDNDQCYFDHLACLSGVDNGPEIETMEVIYTLYSIPRDISLTLKVTLDRKNPRVDSVSSIWAAANWHERETYDLYGIDFQNHPDLRRILLPADWVGYPMRKDYQEDDTYHGMTILHPDSSRE